MAMAQVRSCSGHAFCALITVWAVGAFGAEGRPEHPPWQTDARAQTVADDAVRSALAAYELRRAAAHQRLGAHGAAEQRPAHPMPQALPQARSSGEFAAQTAPANGKRHLVPILPHALPHARTTARQDVVRVANLGDQSGEASIAATDDGGHTYGPVALAIGARQTVALTVQDLQQGNPAKGLAAGFGPPREGDWRLAITSALNLRVHAHVRVDGRVFASAHERVPKVAGERRLALFQPADAAHPSRLRLINPGTEPATVRVRGVDDSGATPGEEAHVRLPPGHARTITAGALENGEGVTGALGDGAGHWRLVLRSDRPIHAAHLLASADGRLANLSGPPTAPLRDGGVAVHRVPLFPDAPAAAGQAQGLLRVVNAADVAGEVAIHARDDAGRRFGPVSLALAARAATHITAHDLEQGNVAKGLSEGLGTGDGNWRLRLHTALDVRVLAHLRAEDGFLADLNATAPRTDGGHEVPLFQGGRLRLVNWGDAPVEATISGVDDNGRASAGEVRVIVPADGTFKLTEAQLESGAPDLAGTLGAGDGAWRLSVRSPEPLQVMSLLPGPNGHLANLSTFAAPEHTTAAGIFAEHIAPIVQAQCARCHVAGGVAAGARLIFERGDDAATEERNLRAFADFLANVEDGADVILHRVQGVGHGGGVQIAGDTEDHAHLAHFLAQLGEASPPAPSPATLFDAVVMEPPSATLRRAALVLAGRVPTQAEHAAVASGDLETLRTTLRGLMSGPAFHAFLIRASNDRLLTDRELARFSVIGNDGHFVDYDREYIRLRDAGGRAVWEWHHAVQYGAGRAPLELIAHVAENDLPYTEILTANYIMANPAVAGVYGAATAFANLEDVHEFQPATITRYHHHGPGYLAHFDPNVGLRVLSPGPQALHHPLAGLLNTKAFLQRYPTTATNRNRARARWAYYHFLGVDVERSAPRTTDPDALADRNNPTLRNPACTVCHSDLDPLAGAFQNYGDSGYFRDQWDGLDALDYFYKNGADSAAAVRGQSAAEPGPGAWRLTLPAGETTLGVTYTNDFYDEATGDDGIIFLDRLRVLDAAEREVAHFEFETATPVAPWGPCGEPAADGHLLLWNGGFECAVHVPVRMHAAGEYRVELYAWGHRHPLYGDEGYAKVSVVADPYHKGDTWYRDMRAPGFHGMAVPDSNQSLAWVARRMADDERFAPATVRFWWPALMGREVAEPPGTEDAPDFHGRLLAATAQQAEVSRLAAGFKRGFRGRPAYNLKDLLVEMVLSPWFRAATVGELDPVRRVALRHAGARRLLTPEELSRKTAALTGVEWGRWHHPARKPHRQRSASLNDEDAYRLLYGGIDSDGVTARARELTSVMAGVAKSHAAHVSCPVVLRELYLLPDAERRLFAGIDADVSPHFALGGDFALATTRKTYSVRGPLEAGAMTVFLKFPNDYADPFGDRNVRLDRLTVRRAGGRVAQTIELETLPAQNNCNLPVDDHYALHCRGWLRVPFTIDAPGDYAVAVHAWADAHGDEAAVLQVVVESDRATATGERIIKRKIVQLHERLLGVSPEEAAAEAETTYDLFVEIWQRKRAAGETSFWNAACHWDSDIHFLDGFLPDAVGERQADYGPYRHWRWGRVSAFWEARDTADPHYAARTWVAVLAHLLTDYRYLHL